MQHGTAAERLAEDGFCQLPGLLDGRAASALLKTVLASRRFDPSLFLSEEEWEASPKTHGRTNPGPGYNMLENIPDLLAFAERNAALNGLLEQILGPGYRILNKRLVGRLPWALVPAWLEKRLSGRPANALGAFVKPPYRNISYYLDVDFHQDIQDYHRFPPELRDDRYITLYIYLDRVTEADAPIQLLPESHRFGATGFQHDVHYDRQENKWHYKDGSRSLATPLISLTGDAGYAAIWHSCMLHGSPPVHAGHFRLSLRYILARSPTASHCALDEINSRLLGPLRLGKDYTPGANANPDGSWNLRMTDYMRYCYEGL